MPALIYHDVIPTEERDASGFQGPGPDRYKLPPELFESHLAAIAAAGRTPALIGRASTLRADDVLLTFDDGGSSAVTHIAPALERRGWLGHFFVPTAYIGHAGFADADGLRRLRAAGHVIGGHSHSHAILTRLTEAEVDTEWRTCKTILEEAFQEEVDTLSVPRGYVTEPILAAAARAGFTHVFTSEPRLGARWVDGSALHGRFSIVSATSPRYVGALCRGSRLARARATSGWFARHTAKRALGPAYEGVRQRVLARR